MKFSWLFLACLYLIHCEENCDDPVFCDIEEPQPGDIGNDDTHESDALPEPEPGSENCTSLNELNDIDTEYTLDLR